MRKFQFQTDEYYHIYNRGVEKRNIFTTKNNYFRFLESMREFNRVEPIKSLYRLNQTRNRSVLDATINSPLVEIISYNLIPNHFHLILKQLVENGISKFMLKLGQGYAMYFNNKYNRSGSLFQGTFKANHINNYGHLLKLLVYVNCNYEIHNLGKAENWIWSSFPDAIGKREKNLCDLNLRVIKEEFKSPKKFQKFCKEIMPELKENKKLQKHLLD